MENSEKMLHCLNSQWGCCLSCSEWEKLSVFGGRSVFSALVSGFCFPACLYKKACRNHIVMKSKHGPPLNFESCLTVWSARPLLTVGINIFILSVSCSADGLLNTSGLCHTSTCTSLGNKAASGRCVRWGLWQ